MKFHGFVQKNQLLLAFLLGLSATLLFPAAYFAVSSIITVTVAILFKPNPRALFALVLGLSIGTFHFLNLNMAVLDSACVKKQFKILAEVEDFPRERVGESGELITLLTLKVRKFGANECGQLGRVSAVIVDSANHPDLVPGDVLEGNAHLNYPDYRWITGSLPRNVRSLSKGISAQLTIHAIEKVEREEGASLSATRVALAEIIATNATSERAERHLQALLLGRQSELEEDDWLALRTFGLTHAFVVSGLHVGLAAIWSYYLVAGFFRLLNVQTSVALRLLMAVGVCVISYGYVGLTGAALPAQRALLMLSITILSRVLLWTVEPLTVVLLTGAILLSINPLSSLTSSFWLSLILTGVIVGQLSRPASERTYGWFSLHIIIVVASSVLTIVFFSQTTWAGFFSNVILVPVLTLISLPLGLIGVLMISVGVEFGTHAVVISSLTLEGLLSIMDYGAFLAGSTLLQPVWLHPGIVAIAGATWLASRLRGPPRVLIVCSVFLSYSSENSDVNKVVVHVVDVGQGTAILIKNDDAVMLYDTGGITFSGRSIIEQGFIRWLKQSGVSTVDMLLVSHGDMDHAGGLFQVMSHFDVRSHYGFGGTSCEVGKEVEFGRVVKVQFLSGTGQLAESRNNDSCVLALYAFQSVILLLGDISRTVELDLLASGRIQPSVDLLIAAHHGSRSSSSAHFIDQVDPKEVVFTSRFGHQFGHPHPSVVNRFRRRGIRTWDTGIRAGMTFEILPNKTMRVSTMRHNLSPYWVLGPPAN